MTVLFIFSAWALMLTLVAGLCVAARRGDQMPPSTGEPLGIDAFEQGEHSPRSSDRRLHSLPGGSARYRAAGHERLAGTGSHVRGHRTAAG